MNATVVLEVFIEAFDSVLSFKTLPIGEQRKASTNKQYRPVTRDDSEESVHMCHLFRILPAHIHKNMEPM